MAGYETWSSRGQPLAVFLWVGTPPQLIPTGHTPFDQHRTDSTRHQRRWYSFSSTISVFSPACRGLSSVEVVVRVVEIGSRRFPFHSTASASSVWLRRGTLCDLYRGTQMPSLGDPHNWVKRLANRSQVVGYVESGQTWGRNGEVWAPRELGHEARDVRRRKAKGPGGTRDGTTVATAAGLGWWAPGGGGVGEQKPSREEQGGTMFGHSLAAPEQAARLEEDQGQLINGSRGK